MRAEQRAEGVKRVKHGGRWPQRLSKLSLQHAYTFLVLVSSTACLQAMEEFVAEIDHNELRPLQKQGFLCGANCCDTARTQEDLQRW